MHARQVRTSVIMSSMMISRLCACVFMAVLIDVAEEYRVSRVCLCLSRCAMLLCVSCVF